MQAPTIAQRCVEVRKLKGCDQQLALPDRQVDSCTREPLAAVDGEDASVVLTVIVGPVGDGARSLVGKLNTATDTQTDRPRLFLDPLVLEIAVGVGLLGP